MADRIAFVDDEEHVLGVLSQIFEKEPYEVHMFDSPSKAFEALEQQPFCVVVSDQMMPEMDGTEFLAQVRERMDGSGYPQGLKKDEILLEVRIVAVADVVESMSSHRPYRPALGTEKALEEIKAGRGTVFDETVVDACLLVFEEDGYTLQS